MIPLLPDLPATPGPSPLSLPQAGAARDAGGARPVLDFAGLLDAALPATAELAAQADPAPSSLAPGLPATSPGPGPVTPVPIRMPGSAPSPGPGPRPVAPLRTGTILPDSGENLPPANPAPPLAAPVEGEAPITQASPRTVADEAVPEMQEAPDVAAALPAVLPAPLPTPDPAPAPAPVAAGLPGRPATSMQDSRAQPKQATHFAARAPVQRDPAATGLSDLSVLPLVTEVPAAIVASAPENLSQPAASPAPGLAPTAAVPVPAIQPAAAVLPPVQAEQPAPREAAAQLESAIAQVGEIREALRAARPEVTLRHAEFGFVSLRIEASGATQDWRAVLASRDPGFVPAVQAALTERMVAAASTDTATTGNGAGHNSPSGEQRYGSSPNGGQASSQPYLTQSGQRDEGTSQHQRQPQHQAADRAAAAPAPDSEEPAGRKRGLFA